MRPEATKFIMGIMGMEQFELDRVNAIVMFFSCLAARNYRLTFCRKYTILKPRNKEMCISVLLAA